MVDVAVKNGASKLPVLKMVAAADWEGPSIVLQAMGLVRQEPKAELKQPEAVLRKPKAEEEVAEAQFSKPTEDDQ